MFSKPAEALQSQIVDLFLTPAAFFWLAGFAAWIFADTARLAPLLARIAKFTDPAILAASAGGLALIAFSGAAYEPINGWVVKRLAGYWGIFAVLGAPLRAAIRWRVGISRNFASENIREKLNHYYPGDEPYVATTFGCALVASDLRIFGKYGMSADICWLPLSYVLPEFARKSVADAQAAIEASARLLFWTFASLVWLRLATNAVESSFIAAGVVAVAAFAYLRLIRQGRAFGDAYENAFDVGRFALYEALRIPLPVDNQSETATGAIVTKIVRGWDQDLMRFAHPK